MIKLSQMSYEVTFDDILLLPGHSDFSVDLERTKISLTSKIGKHLTLTLPIMSSPMAGVTEQEMAITMARAGGIGIIHFFMELEEQLMQVKRVKKQGLIVGAAVSDLTALGYKHCENLIKVGVDLISLESLHSDTADMISMLKKLRKNFPKVEVSTAHVVTAEATEAVIRAGATSVRVGIGGGSHCTTRLMTGVGRPQISAVLDCAKVAHKYRVPLISDTGIKYPGDIAKALACGASAVMIGSMLAGTDKSPGEVVRKKGKYYKYSSGNCSSQRTFKQSLLESLRGVKREIVNVLKHRLNNGVTTHFEEGISGFIPYSGTTVAALDKLETGLRRSLWYVGATNVSDLQKKARAIVTSHNTLAESKPRI